MLRLLMKYEFKAVRRIMLPLYGAWMVISVVFGLAIKLFINDSGLPVIILGMIYSVVTVTVIILTIILVIQRFYKNLLGNEGYLMFTLPVSIGKHVWNKTISASIWVVFGTILGLISAGIIAVCNGGLSHMLQAINQMITEITEQIGTGITAILVIEVIVLALLMCGEAALKIYAAISVGHQWSNHRVLGAIGAYLGFAIVEVIISNIISKVNDAMGIAEKLLDWSRTMNITAQTQLGILFLALLTCIFIAIYYVITYKLLEKKLNLQ